MRGKLPVFLIVVMMGVFMLTGGFHVVVAQAGAQAGEGKIWEGVYTVVQATQGRQAYAKSCASCHGEELLGIDRGTASPPALAGDRFMASWEAGSLNRLFTKMRTEMPQDAPGSLDESTYLDILSFILEVNKFPSGNNQLTAAPELLNSVQIMRKGGGAVPNFALVQVVGCLTQGPDNAWMLTNTTEPVVVTRDQADGAPELKALDARPLGNQAFRLISVARFKPSPHQGHKMEARGLLYREPNESRLNLTALQMIGSSCAN